MLFIILIGSRYSSLQCKRCSSCIGLQKSRFRARSQSSNPATTTSFHVSRPFESHYYCLLLDVPRDKPDLFCVVNYSIGCHLLSCSWQERRFQTKAFDEGKLVEIFDFGENALLLCIALVASAFLIGSMCHLWQRTLSRLRYVRFCSQCDSLLEWRIELWYFGYYCLDSAVLIVFVGSNIDNVAPL